MTRTLEDGTAGTIAIGDIRVRRLGFGAMRIWQAAGADGRPDRAAARALCRRVHERGVNFIDTADIYGPGGIGQSEEIIAEALHPYPPGLLIATKAGFLPGGINPANGMMPVDGRPEHIRAACEASLRRLRVECIDLYQSHVPDPSVPYEDTIGAFADLQRAGKIRHVGVSNVSRRHLAAARAIVPVVSVQNRFNVGDQASAAVLQACADAGIAFVPWAPMIFGGTGAEPQARAIAQARGVPLQQVALSWLLRRSPSILPIPGTSDIRHLDENVDAAWLDLSAEDLSRLDGEGVPAR
ncbi:MAG: aldo/keto reductase [Gammaproteobacteria bacterium]